MGVLGVAGVGGGGEKFYCVEEVGDGEEEEDEDQELGEARGRRVVATIGRHLIPQKPLCIYLVRFHRLRLSFSGCWVFLGRIFFLLGSSVSRACMHWSWKNQGIVEKEKEREIRRENQKNLDLLSSCFFSFITLDQQMIEREGERTWGWIERVNEERGKKEGREGEIKRQWQWHGYMQSCQVSHPWGCGSEHRKMDF